jgi:hypothetical protein
VRSGKITVDSANAGLAELRHLLEKAAHDLRRGIVGIDQHGKTGQSFLFGFHTAPSVVAAVIAYWRILLIPENAR